MIIYGKRCRLLEKILQIIPCKADYRFIVRKVAIKELSEDVYSNYRHESSTAILQVPPMILHEFNMSEHPLLVVSRRNLLLVVSRKIDPR
jgi:hypothetical protein